MKGKGKGHSIVHVHVLSGDFTVLLATHAFIHEWNQTSKVTIVTGSSRLSEEYDVHHLHFTSPEGSTFLAFLAYFRLVLSMKAVHSLKTQRLGIVLASWAIIVPISAFPLLLVSQVACGE